MMSDDTIDHLYSLRPQLDVLGQWACVMNAKTASTSITDGVLSHRVIMHHRGSRNWERVWRQVIVPRIDDVVWFTVVRNPWDRMVSVFHFLRQRGDLPQGLDFPAWIENLDLTDHFTAPQARSFMLDGKQISSMHVLRFENLQEEWAVLASVLGVSGQLPHRNRSSHRPYAEYYNQKTRQAVADRYAVEIAALSYRFEPAV